jgi:hypothetical protein
MHTNREDTMSYQPRTVPEPVQGRSPLPWVIGGVAVVITVCITVLIMHGQTSQPTAATPPASAVSADQQLVDQVNAIKAHYPQDATARVTVGTLPAFLHVGCSVISSGLGTTPEWKDIAALLAQAKRCPPAAEPTG